MALVGETVDGETPLTADDLQGLKLPFVKTRAQLNTVEAANILTAKQWAMRSRLARMPNMLTAEFLQILHRRMFVDVWGWAGEIRSTALQNDFATSVANIRPDLLNLYQDAAEYWLADKNMSPDEFAARVHHRIVKNSSGSQWQRSAFATGSRSCPGEALQPAAIHVGWQCRSWQWRCPPTGVSDRAQGS